MALADAIDSLYAAFSSVPRPRAINFCTHCWTEEETELLLASGPLRELPVNDLRPYAASA